MDFTGWSNIWTGRRLSVQPSTGSDTHVLQVQTLQGSILSTYNSCSMRQNVLRDDNKNRFLSNLLYETLCRKLNIFMSIGFVGRRGTLRLNSVLYPVPQILQLIVPDVLVRINTKRDIFKNYSKNNNTSIKMSSAHKCLGSSFIWKENQHEICLHS